MEIYFSSLIMQSPIEVNLINPKEDHNNQLATINSTIAPPFKLTSVFI